METIFNPIDDKSNNIVMMRDDLLPFSFGGNKVRKGLLYFEEILKKNKDYVVTYGSSSSNHCRVIANLAVKHNIPCIIISPEENKYKSNNLKFMDLFDAEIIFTNINHVKGTIESTLKQLKNMGFNPYFIPGGGHGNVGTKAYVNAYKEIIKYEKKNNINFDYIFLASGTGGTQAGLIIGSVLNKDNKKIIGISVGRNDEKGKITIMDSICNYLPKTINSKEMEEKVFFTDEYLAGGYSKYNKEIKKVIHKMLIYEGIPLDTTYTGKAFWGMTKYIKNKKIKNKSILFIHTGGTPIFFDNLKEL